VHALLPCIDFRVSQLCAGSYNSTVDLICYFVTPLNLDEHANRLIRAIVENIYSSKFLFTVLVNATVGIWKVAIGALLYAKADPDFEQLEQLSFWYNVAHGNLYHFLHISAIYKVAVIACLLPCLPMLYYRRISLRTVAYVVIR